MKIFKSRADRLAAQIQRVPLKHVPKTKLAKVIPITRPTKHKDD